MAEMGNSASDTSNKSDDEVKINNNQLEDSVGPNLTQITSEFEVSASDTTDINLTAPLNDDVSRNSVTTEKPVDQYCQNVLPISGDDSKVEETVDESITKAVESIKEEKTPAPFDEILMKSPTESNKSVPATPPATPVTIEGSPQFQSPKLDSTFTLSADGDNVSNPFIPESNLTEVINKPATSNEAITAPILEAAAIANAVAGISISTSSNPVNISTTSAGTPIFSPFSETSQVSKTNTDVLASASEETIDASLKNVRDDEVEILRARVHTLESELIAAMSKPGTKNHVLVETIKQQHEELLSKARGMLFDKTKIVKNQELQIQALTTQVSSLKDVNSITKDLLEIRNSEIKHLEERLSNMEARFKAEKERHMLMLKRAETGQNINNDLKTEYEGQLKIFKDLREMYDQRVQALTRENQHLKECLAAAKELSSKTT